MLTIVFLYQTNHPNINSWMIIKRWWVHLKIKPTLKDRTLKSNSSLSYSYKCFDQMSDMLKKKCLYICMYYNTLLLVRLAKGQVTFLFHLVSFFICRLFLEIFLQPLLKSLFARKKNAKNAILQPYLCKGLLGWNNRRLKNTMILLFLSDN